MRGSRDSWPHALWVMLVLLLGAASACGRPDAGTPEPASGGNAVETPVPNVAAAPGGGADLDTTAGPVSITGMAAGCVAIGATPAEVRAACGTARDTIILLEGMSQPALAVELDGAAALAEVVDGRVWRITVLEPGPATTGGLSVGTPASRLAAYTYASVSAGEGRYFVTVPDLCGLSFGLEGLPFDATPPTAEELATALTSVRVSRILVLGGC